MDPFSSICLLTGSHRRATDGGAQQDIAAKRIHFSLPVALDFCVGTVSFIVTQLAWLSASGWLSPPQSATTHDGPLGNQEPSIGSAAARNVQISNRVGSVGLRAPTFGPELAPWLSGSLTCGEQEAAAETFSTTHCQRRWLLPMTTRICHVLQCKINWWGEWTESKYSENI